MAAPSSALPPDAPSAPESAFGTAPPLHYGLLIGLSGFTLLVHLLTNGRYGYFRDELYFLDCGRHLAWGYVDMAPMVALFARIGLWMGGSLHAIRFFPALAAAGLVALTMLMTRELGGGRFAQGLAGLCVIVAAIYRAIDSILSMNAFEPLFWMGCVYVLIRTVKTAKSRLWLWFGVLAGLSLLNKHSTLFFGLAVCLALLLVPERREFTKPWFWLGGAVAVLLFLPNVVWQAMHHFPTVEDLRNVQQMGKNVVLGPGAFVAQQVFIMHPITLPIWLTGLASFLVGRQSRLRVLGWTFLILFALMFVFKAKNYYLAPIYPMLFASGAGAIEAWLARATLSRERLWPKLAMIVLIALAGALFDVLALPIPPPEKYIAYQGALGLRPPKTEVHHEGPLPQLWGDQFGWPELVAEVAKIYWSLSPEERARTGIFASNYGEAGAIDLFGPQYGLPRAICAHQNHYFWGPPSFSVDTLIVLQADRKHLEQYFQAVEQVGEHYHRWGMAEENHPIFLCRGPKFTWAQAWPRLKHWD